MTDKACEGPLAGVIGARQRVTSIYEDRDLVGGCVLHGPAHLCHSKPCWPLPQLMHRVTKHARAAQAQVCARAVDGPQRASHRVRQRGRWGLKRGVMEWTWTGWKRTSG